MAAIPPKPSLVKTTLSIAQSVTDRVNALLPTVPSALSPVTVFQAGTVGVGGQLNAPTSVFPAGAGYYGVWTAPDLNNGKPYTVQVECFGGGGGGGGGSLTTGGGGGGGGEYAAERFYPVKPGQAYVWIVGVPGSPGTANGDDNQGATAGGTGGLTLFDIAGTGVAGGVAASGGQGGDVGNTGLGGAGGAGSLNTFEWTGGAGGTNLPGSGGGGSGGQGGTDSPVALFAAGLLSAAPQAWYIMNDASSTGLLNDATGNRNTAQPGSYGGGGLAFAQPGAPSQVPAYAAGGNPPSSPNPTVASGVLQFVLKQLNQQSGYILCPGFTFQGPQLTISGWIAPDVSGTWGNTATGSRAVIASNCEGYANSSTAGVALYFKQAGTPSNPNWQLNFYCSSGGSSRTVTVPLAPVVGAYYVVATFDHGAMTLYVNGSVAGTASASFSSLPGWPTVPFGMTIGADPQISTDWFFGFMSNFWFADGLLDSGGVDQAFNGSGGSSTLGGAGGGASGGPEAVGGDGAAGSGSAGGAGGTPAVQPVADIGLNTPASPGLAGAAGGAGNSGFTGAAGAGGGGAGSSSSPPSVNTITVPFVTAASYCGTDAAGGAAASVYNPVIQGTTGRLFTGGQAQDTASGSKNSLLILPPNLAAQLSAGSFSVLRVTLTVTSANPQATQNALMQVGWAPDTFLPITYDASDTAGSAGVVEIPVGAFTVTADLTESQLGTYLQNGTAKALVLGPGPAPTFAAYNSTTAADFYTAIYGPGAVDSAGNSLAPFLTITYAEALAPSPTVPSGVPGSWSLVFDDEFSGSSVDPTKWAVDNFTVNNVLSTPANATVSGGQLSLTLNCNNVLTGQNTNFDGGIGSWAGSANCTAGSVASPVHSGTGAMSVTSAAAGNMTVSGGTSNTATISAGQQILGSAWVRAATAGRTCRLQFDFFSGGPFGNYVTTIDGPNISDTTTGYTQMTDGGNIFAPATADTVFISVGFLSAGAAGEVHYVDDVVLNPVTGATLLTNNYALPVGSFTEARISFPGSGPDTLYNWPAFWTSGPNWPAAGENDIAEVAGFAGGDSSMSINYHSPSGAHGETTPAVSSGNWANAFHTYGLYRKGASCDVYYDGSLVATYSTDDNGAAQQILLTIGGTAGVNSLYGAGSAVLVDYVRAWTPAGVVQQGSPGGAGAILVTFLNQAETLVGSWNSTDGIQAQGGQLTETTVVLGSTLKNAGRLGAGLDLDALLDSPDLLDRLSTALGKRLGVVPGAPGTLLGYTAGTTAVTQTTPGTYTFTVPADVTSVSVQCWGGGAGATGGNSGTGQGGGGGGAYAAEPAYAVVPGQVITYTVGAGGTGDHVGSNSSPDGGASVFDTTNLAGAGVRANGGQHYSGAFNYGPGGVTSGNTVAFAGGNGGPLVSGQNNGSGGGGSAGSAGKGGNASQNGTRGSAGSGGGANGGAGASSGNGASGSAPGGGGGGASQGSSGLVGGSGGAGKVVLTYVSSTVLNTSIATASGTDAAGNPFPAGVMTNALKVNGAQTITGGTTTTGGTSTDTLAVSGNASVGGSHSVTGNVTAGGVVNAGSQLLVNAAGAATMEVGGNAHITSDTQVDGNFTLGGNGLVSGGVHMQSLAVDNNASIGTINGGPVVVGGQSVAGWPIAGGTIGNVNGSGTAVTIAGGFQNALNSIYNALVSSGLV